MKLIWNSVINSQEQFEEMIREQIVNLIGFSDKINLVGPLGAGKTFFSRNLLSALGSTDLVTSPTFTLVNEYEIHPHNLDQVVNVKHLDFYRLKDFSDIREDIPIEDIMESEDLVLVEWGSLFPQYGEFDKEIIIDFESQLADNSNEGEFRSVKVYSK